MRKNKLPAISLFSGALGLDLGLEKAGFDIRVAVECNKYAAETIRKNRPDIPVIEKKLEDVSTEELLREASLSRGEPILVIGGPSCQAFSTVGKRESLADPRGAMFRDFLRVVRDVRPRFFIMENVKGILSAAVRHRPLRKRGPGFPPLKPDEELGSAFLQILKELSATSYYTVFDVLNAADFGVPQARERVFFIGSRAGEAVALPEKTHARDPVNGEVKWISLREGLRRLKDPRPEHGSLTKSKEKYLRMIPPGGNWRDLPESQWPDALGGAYESWGGRGGFLRRLTWNRPAPALTTQPNSSATLLCHPKKLRPLSVKEYARLQQFPDDWEFVGGTSQKYIQIGNAVPVGLGEAVGRALLRTMRKRKKPGKRSSVACHNDGLIARLAKRPDTILNPPSMRKAKTAASAHRWKEKCSGTRKRLINLILVDGNGHGREGKKATRRSKSR